MHIVDYVGEIIAEFMRGKKGMGMVQDHTALEEKTVIQMTDLTHLWWIVLLQEEWLHLLTTSLNLKLMLGMCLMRTEMYIQLQQLKIFTQEKKFFVIMGTSINFMGI